MESHREMNATRTDHARGMARSALLLAALISACTGEITGDAPATDEPETLDPTGPSDDGGDDDGDGVDDADEVVDEPTQPTYPTAHPRIYLGAHRARLEATLAAGTSAATKFRAKVDQWVGGASLWGFRAWNAALLGQLTGDAKYCTKAVGAVEQQVTAAESKIAAGQNPDVALDSYLEIGELVGDLALVYDWCFPQVTSSQRARWIAYANQAVWNVWNHTQAKWGSRSAPWTGWSVNNPSNNYYYSFLRATMLLGLATKGENPQADTWIEKFREHKILGQLVPTFESDLVGGASREGTGYGVAMRRLFELYDWWKATTGESLATKTGHTRASLFAFIHQTVPTLDKVAPTGDHARDSTATFFDYHRDYAQQLVMLFPSTNVARRAKALLDGSNVPAMTSSFMLVYDFLADDPDLTPMPMSGLNWAYHAKGIGEIYARSSWDKDATWVNLIAGPYTESHAHQDQGSIMIYKGGWLAHDANVHSKSGLNQATTAHGLVRIDQNGAPIKQVASTTSTVLALHQGPSYLHVAADLTPAYKAHPAVQKVQRELIYVLPDVVIVYDRVASAAGTTQTWQLQAPTAPSISGARATISNAGHTLAVHRIVGGTLRSHDQRADADLTGGYRLDESVAGGDNRYLHVLGVDGAVASASANGSDGVTITLANGQTISATFARNGIGATLVLGGQTIALGAGVDKLPE